MRKRRKERGDRYILQPRVSFVVQFFNKRHNVRPILDRLRQVQPEEIIVNDDGSVDGTHEECLQQLDRPNEFLIRYNNLHEILGYDRALRFSRGEFACFLQDDDLPPLGRQWVDDALALFISLPKLIILGGRDGLKIRLSHNPRERYEVFAAANFPKFGKGHCTESPPLSFPLCSVQLRTGLHGGFAVKNS